MSYKTQVGYTDEFRAQHEARLAEKEAQLEHFRRENEEAKRKYFAGLEVQKLAKRQEAEAEVEASLTPDKEREQRTWLANHPDKTVADFNRHAWPQLRLNIIAARQAQDFVNIKAQLKATGRYQF